MAKVKKHAEVIKIHNCSKQMISLQLRAPGADFYHNEQQAHLGAGKTVTLLKHHVRIEQIENLCKRGSLRIVYDSSK